MNDESSRSASIQNGSRPSELYKLIDTDVLSAGLAGLLVPGHRRRHERFGAN